MLSVELHIFLYRSLGAAESRVVDGSGRLMSCDKALVSKQKITKKKNKYRAVNRRLDLFHTLSGTSRPSAVCQHGQPLVVEGGGRREATSMVVVDTNSEL